MSLISEKLLNRRPQELGKIKIGGKGELRRSTGGNDFRLPVKYDHFVITTLNRGEDDNFIRNDEIHEKIGEAPTELAGVLMYPEPEQNLHAEMVQYRGRTKVVGCDGEERTELESGARSACPRLEGGDCECKPYGRLHLQLWASPHMFGYHVFRTTSWESTANIQSVIKEIYERFGTCYKAPVRLVLYPSTDTYMDGNKERTSESYKVGLVLAMSLEEAAEEMVRAKRLMDSTRRELLQIAGEVQEDLTKRDQEEAADIAEEFFPEQAVQSSVGTQEKLDEFKGELAEDEEPPIVEGEFEIEEDDDGATDEAPNEEAPSEPEKSSYDQARDEYVALRTETGGGKEFWTRWQEEQVGKANAGHFSEEEYRKGIQLIRDGVGMGHKTAAPTTEPQGAPDGPPANLRGDEAAATADPESII